MKVEKILDPVVYFKSFSMHDVRVESMTLNFKERTFELKVLDLNWNYEGSPEHVERPCFIVFGDVVSHFIDVFDSEGVRIDHSKAQMVDNLIQVDIDLNEGGGNSSWGKDRSSISIQFRSMKIVDR
jgi:hypothetical protein